MAARLAQEGQGNAAAMHARRQRQAQLHGLLSGMAAEHPAFPATARLADRWVAAHLMSNQICHEAVELLVAAAFLPESGLPPPGAAAAPPDCCKVSSKLVYHVATWHRIGAGRPDALPAAPGEAPLGSAAPVCGPRWPAGQRPAPSRVQLLCQGRGRSSRAV